MKHFSLRVELYNYYIFNFNWSFEEIKFFVQKILSLSVLNERVREE